MAWGLGIAFTSKGDLTRTIAIVRHDTLVHNSENSKLYSFLINHTQNKNGHYIITLSNKKLGKVTLNFKECGWSEAYTLLKKGGVTIILEDCGKEVNYHFDPANTEAQMLFEQINGILTYGMQFYASNENEIKPLTISGTRYIDFLVPGLLSMGIMMSTMWGISYTVIDRRSKKLLRRMVATPLRKSNFLVAIIIGRFFMNVIEALLLFLFSWLYFGTSIQGSLGALFLVFIAGNIAFSGIAVLISSRTANSEIGNGLINAIVTPMMVISGIFVSYHSFPQWALPVIRNLPLTMLADSVRSIFNEGAGFSEIWFETIVLLATGTISFILGLKIFRWY